MGDGTRENPYTREDVLRLIEENGDKAEGLDLSGKVFEENIDLGRLNLVRIILKKAVFLVNVQLELADSKGAQLDGADLRGAHLEGASLGHAQLEWADLWGAHLEQASLVDAHLEGALLWDAHLEGAFLSDAHLEGADLKGAHLEGASLHDAQFSADTRLETVDWGRNYVLGEEKGEAFHWAADTYRRLKQWYTNAGIYDVAGEFYYREMEARRKDLKSRKPVQIHHWWLELFNLLCGYGERPLRVVRWAALVILVSTLIYFVVGSVWEWSAFWNSLYFSAVSFVALGYGGWVEVTNNWVKGIGVLESFIGVFTMALFLVTFTRKMTR
jgi:hypothetical protein